MKKIFGKKLLSLLIVAVLIFPNFIFATSETDTIEFVYFQDENGNMVFVDYAKAIDDAVNGDFTLYNAIKQLVGITESKGKPLYIKTNTGILLNYALAMVDGQFRLQDIIGVPRYQHNEEIEYTHELKLVDGQAKIVPTVEEGSNYTININGPIELDIDETGEFDVRTFGDSSGEKEYRARFEYEISGGEGRLEYLHGNEWVEIPLEGFFGPQGGYVVPPNWDFATDFRFTPSVEGVYSASISLIDLDTERIITDAEHIVTVISGQAFIVEITPVQGISVEFGTTMAEAIGQLPPTTTILDNKNITHTVNLNWTIEDYNENAEGIYNATARFDLPEGVVNTNELDLVVNTTVEVLTPTVEDFPEEVEEVVVGISAITNKTYANINIKDEYVEDVEAVYVDQDEAIQIENNPFQWRIEVEEGTTVDDLRGRIRVETGEEPVPDPAITNVMPNEDLTVRQGETVEISFNAPSGGQGYYRIYIPITNGLNTLGNPMQEVSDGLYSAIWIAPNDMIAEDLDIEVIYTTPDGEILKQYAQGKITVMPAEESVDKTALEVKITEAQALNPEDYTDDSWENLQTILNLAIAVNDNPEATQIEVDDATTNLSNAIEDLVEIEQSIEDALEAKIAEAELLLDSLNEDDYRPEDWSDLMNAVRLAKEHLLDEDVTEGKLHEDLQRLINTMEDLSLKIVAPSDATIIGTLHRFIVPSFGRITIEVGNLSEAEKFVVTYRLADSEDGTENWERTPIANIGDETDLIFFNPDKFSTVDISIYNSNDEYLCTFDNVYLVIAE